jgi:hypothetical protein
VLVIFIRADASDNRARLAQPRVNKLLPPVHIGRIIADDIVGLC